ncbi:MAG: transposase, partial [Pseudomonadota bacterium]
MARKRHSDEDVLKLLREIELKLTAGDDVASACRSVGISDAAYSNWRRRFGAVAAVGDEEPGKRERATEELEGSEKAPVGRFPRTTVAER